MNQKIPFSLTNTFSKLFLDYISEDISLAKFYGLFPKLENFKSQIENKNFTHECRKNLVEALQKQYRNMPITPNVIANIERLLDSKTYTVTTGHQLAVFGGPLYFIYKIITTINTAKELAKNYPDYKFVPVFWMASEDHDFEEINHFHLFGKTWVWESNQKGAVGRMNVEGLDKLVDSLPEKVAVFEKAYKEKRSLAEATRYFIHELFGEDGLVIVDGDDPFLKKEFAIHVKDELENKVSYSLVTNTSTEIQKLGYSTQVNPREINLFYLDGDIRERIVYDGARYRVNNTSLVFSKEEISKLVDSNPEKFSPNVILRPLYQEVILPNLAYIGGPAEVIYWLQLKAVFEHHKIAMPIIMPRNFCLFLSKSNKAKLEKLNLRVEELFLTDEKYKSILVAKYAEEDFSLEVELKKLAAVFENIKEKAGKIDKTMEPVTMAELQKGIKGIQDLEKKLKKIEEKKNEGMIVQASQLKSKLFPHGSLQERYDNYLNFQLNNPKFIEQLKMNFNPFDYSFYVLSENE